ncbi:putative receptor-like protein kinase At3g47110 [Jatropha curcas]|uniref:putative receptor-like protein kinase At3g47110 n=1 Tax=Jatropha curcas TaxID=180498 RepID=UPI001893F908|nr:putative receptor-like protein kinase At3g47110 [Jatropha curcas]
MFTRKRPTDDMFKEDWNLHEFVKSAFPNRASTIIDPILIQEGGQSDDKIMMECLISILGIGISCSVESPIDRIDISDAAMNLFLIRDKEHTQLVEMILINKPCSGSRPE